MDRVKNDESANLDFFLNFIWFNNFLFFFSERTITDTVNVLTVVFSLRFQLTRD